MSKIFIIIGFIIFFIINLLSGFYLSKFIKKFLEAFPIFIKDILTRDKEVFSGYGFWCYCGLGGSGKTISMVNYLSKIKEKYPKVKILTNFSFDKSDGKILSWRDLLEATNIHVEEITEKQYNKFKKYKVYSEEKGDLFLDIEDDELKFKVVRNHGVIYGFDEIHLTFESTKWEDAPSNLLDYISQQRKFHKLIVSTSQVFTRIDKKLREQTNYVIECKSYLKGRLVTNKFFDTPTYISNGEKLDKGAKRRKPRKRDVFVAVDSIRQQYNTEEIMKELRTGKSANSRLIDLIQNFRKEE